MTAVVAPRRPIAQPGSPAAGGARLGQCRARGAGPGSGCRPVRVSWRRVLLRRDRTTPPGRRAGQPDAGAVSSGRLVRGGGWPAVGVPDPAGVGRRLLCAARRLDLPGVRGARAPSGGGGGGGGPDGIDPRGRPPVRDDDVRHGDHRGSPVDAGPCDAEPAAAVATLDRRRRADRRGNGDQDPGGDVAGLLPARCRDLRTAAPAGQCTTMARRRDRSAPGDAESNLAGSARVPDAPGRGEHCSRRFDVFHPAGRVASERPAGRRAGDKRRADRRLGRPAALPAAAGRRNRRLFGVP